MALTLKAIWQFNPGTLQPYADVCQVQLVLQSRIRKKDGWNNSLIVHHIENASTTHLHLFFRLCMLLLPEFPEVLVGSFLFNHVQPDIRHDNICWMVNVNLVHSFGESRWDTTLRLTINVRKTTFLYTWLWATSCLKMSGKCSVERAQPRLFNTTYAIDLSGSKLDKSVWSVKDWATLNCSIWDFHCIRTASQFLTSTSIKFKTSWCRRLDDEMKLL